MIQSTIWKLVLFFSFFGGIWSNQILIRKPDKGIAEYIFISVIISGFVLWHNNKTLKSNLKNEVDCYKRKASELNDQLEILENRDIISIDEKNKNLHIEISNLEDQINTQNKLIDKYVPKEPYKEILHERNVEFNEAHKMIMKSSIMKTSIGSDKRSIFYEMLKNRVKREPYTNGYWKTLLILPILILILTNQMAISTTMIGNFILSWLLVPIILLINNDQVNKLNLRNQIDYHKKLIPELKNKLKILEEDYKDFVEARDRLLHDNDFQIAYIKRLNALIFRKNKLIEKHKPKFF